MAEEQGRRASRATSQTPSADTKSKRKAKGSKKPRSAPRQEPLSGSDLLTRRVLPLVSVVLAFVGMVLLYHRIFPPVVVEPAPEVEAPAQGSADEEQKYAGVESPWTSSGTFTMGNEGMDGQIKAYCDALSNSGYTAAQNAEAVYDAIVWGAYEERTEEQKPAGLDWDVALARHYFDTGDPAAGVGGAGDVYEFAAVSSFCLRYFGFDDAIAVPVLVDSTYGGQTESAYVLVSDGDGNPCVCDPNLSGDGWMLDRSGYDVVVEDIGQDLSKVEELGITVKQGESQQVDSKSESGRKKKKQAENKDDEDDQTEEGYSYTEEYPSDEYYAYDGSY